MTQVEVRATVNLPELAVGQVALVDPARPYIATLLEGGILVRTGREPRDASAPPPVVPVRGRQPRKKAA